MSDEKLIKTIQSTFSLYGLVLSRYIEFLYIRLIIYKYITFYHLIS